MREVIGLPPRDPDKASDDDRVMSEAMPFADWGEENPTVPGAKT